MINLKKINILIENNNELIGFCEFLIKNNYNVDFDYNIKNVYYFPTYISYVNYVFDFYYNVKYKEYKAKNIIKTYYRLKKLININNY